MLNIISAEDYFEKTETAVRRILDGIQEYLELLRPVRELTWVSGELGDDHGVENYLDWLNKNQDKVDKAGVARQKFRAQSFAMAVLCGSLLQVAEKAINEYSSNAVVPIENIFLVRSASRASHFYIGREVRGVPIGLIVYAGRNQHIHCDEGELRDKVNVAVFSQLSRIKDHPEYLDPAFDLSERRLDSYASNITALLKWRSYDAYIKDMRSMLGLSPE